MRCAHRLPGSTIRYVIMVGSYLRSVLSSVPHIAQHTRRLIADCSYLVHADLLALCLHTLSQYRTPHSIIRELSTALRIAAYAISVTHATYHHTEDQYQKARSSIR
eukprot:154496-Rhodomonas_salina.1